MPELPEIETIARDLDRALRGAVISAVRVTRADVLRETTAAKFRARLAGVTIERGWRRAKLIVLDLSSGDRIVIQPRFTGAVLVDAGDLSEEERRYSTMTLTLTDGRVVHYRDIRRLGTVTLMGPDRFAAYIGALGPEPLDPAFTVDNFRDVLRKPAQAVKKVIMDQRQLVGVGNIYANEALWRAGIDPSRSARRIAVDEADSLQHALTDVLTEAIAARGTSFRDYRDAYGDHGAFGRRLAAYGRAGLPCLRCQTRLVGTHAIDGRQTVFCFRCQR
jgi:formamidopyrimidine-DNA glycosylase